MVVLFVVLGISRDKFQIPAFGLLRARRLANPAVNVKDGP